MHTSALAPALATTVPRHPGLARGSRSDSPALLPFAGRMSLVPLPRRTDGGYPHSAPAMRSHPRRLVVPFNVAGSAPERGEELGDALDQLLAGFEHVERVDRALRLDRLHQRTVPRANLVHGGL